MERKYFYFRREVNFLKNTFYRGRNGVGKQTGVLLEIDPQELRIMPINTTLKRISYSAIISIPKEHIDELIYALTELKKNYEMSKV